MEKPTTDGSSESREEPSLASDAVSHDVPNTAKPRSGLGLLARRVHFLAGFAVAPFLAIMCLTGLANAFTPQIVDTLHEQELFVDTDTGSPRPVSDQVAAAVAANPEGTVKAVIPPTDEDRTTGIVLSKPGLPDVDEFADEDLTVYVNPHTNRVQGELITVKDRPPAQAWLRHSHGNLHLGPPGRLYSEFATTWLPVIVACGLALWVAQRRSHGSRGLFTRSRRPASKYARLRSVHGSLGLLLSLGLVALAVTGFSQSNYVGDRVDQLLETFDSTAPELTTEKVPVSPGEEQIGIDHVVETADAEGMRGELTFTAPAEPGAVWQVAETSAGWPIQKDSIAVDPYTGQVIERVTFDDYPLLAKLNVFGVQAHDGTLFGIVNQVVVSLLALGTLVLIVLAYRMWWNRRPRHALWPPNPPPVWRSLSKAELLALVITSAILAWAMPVLGVTLIGFIVLDALINIVKRRRTRT
ncbi:MULTISPECIES: PepSY-associated TM helix domain-containing protein [Prauserella salsuginis group]|uniref:PepSY-associated TM helix domain-containing protein n=1 Tax=Prauserella salsuginis TaxID=387889 RepID=A0ABW6G7M7_9PSEU|nr:MULTISPECIES: PepSY domain-containing protein [Prauserella salsuginis group]MCR3719569.1 putative iron-regulated membrane protein [Prauserella flava]MCR3735417.1 putative iron-regulated membrane protein [Prauserella salsuginis]